MSSRPPGRVGGASREAGSRTCEESPEDDEHERDEVEFGSRGFLQPVRGSAHEHAALPIAEIKKKIQALCNRYCSK